MRAMSSATTTSSAGMDGICKCHLLSFALAVYALSKSSKATKKEYQKRNGKVDG